MRIGFEKKFKVGPPDRTGPDPTRWKITTRAGELEGEITYGPDLDAFVQPPAGGWPNGIKATVTTALIRARERKA